MKNVLFLSLALSLFACKQSPQLPPIASFSEIESASIAELSQLMEEGRLTSAQLVDFYLQRIDSLDQNGPKVNSVLLVNPEAKEIAQKMDEERSQGKVRSAMHGIPVLLKDNIDTHDQMPNTAGSIAMKGHMPKQDAGIVVPLREAGVVILGKTNLSEWANFRSTSSSSGWSSMLGQTGNPYQLNMTPCGSSAGSGSAVAANFATVAIGTETNGSIGCPSSVNGIVGIKPTVGLWSRSGIIPISHTQDTPGPMARSVMDAATFLNIGVQKDERDPATAEVPAEKVDYTASCVEGALQGKRLGVDTAYLNLDTDVGQVFAKAVADLKAAGAEIVPLPLQSQMGGSDNADEYTLLLYEFKADLNAYLAEANAPYKTLEELIAFNKEHEEEAMPLFKQEIFEMAQEKGPLTDTAYVNASTRVLEKTRNLIHQSMEEHQLSAIVGPTTGQAWTFDLDDDDTFNGPASYGIAAISGYPHISVPMGQIEGLPLGLCFIGDRWMESTIIGLAYDYEQKTKHFKAPTYKLK